MVDLDNARMTVNFKFGLGDEVLHKHHSISGVVTSATTDRSGINGYWFEYTTSTNEIKEAFARETELNAGQEARS